MTNAAITTLLAFITVGISWRAYHILCRPRHLSPTEAVDLPDGIPVQDIGIIERDLVYLKNVTVVANTVQPPTSTLAEAVEHNFRRGVKYTFLVSHSREQDEMRGYVKIFKAYAEVVRGCGEISDLVEVKKLPYDWDDYPYIFYTLQLPNGKEKTLAFWGDRLHHGLASHYGRVEPQYAHTIARALVSEAPVDISGLTADRTQFDLGAGKVIKFTPPPATASIQ